MKVSLRILFVLPYVPSLIRVRSFQIIRSLAEAGHRITVVALDDGHIDPARTEQLASACERVHVVPHPRWRAALNCLGSLPTPVPLWGAYARSEPMARLLSDLAGSGRFDVAHVEHLRAAHLWSSLGSLPRVLDAVDCIVALRRQITARSQGMRWLASAWEGRKLAWYEPRTYRHFDRVAVTSRHDEAALRQSGLGERSAIDVIPNGTDLGYFRPNGDGGPEGRTVIFSGKMSYVANEDAARFLLTELMPRLRRRFPDLALILAGSGPSMAIKSLARSTGGVTVTEYVDDIRPFLERARFAICPMRISVGIQNKALEAMAMGRPVVATPLAGRALPGAVECGALRLAESADDLASACATFLSDPEMAERAGREARRYVEAHHRWETAADRFTESYLRAIADHRRQ
ncbi:MAG: glycosyltransferase [Capsulimonadales bacterium]|nr:glycosyltransferase [Capsulimonadales bacterium]